MKDEEKRLWKNYYDSGTIESRNELVLYYQVLVNRCVNRIRRAAGIDRADLVQFAQIGLINAIEKYDMSLGYDFGTFAYHRIRGAIIDSIRTDRTRDVMRGCRDSLYDLESFVWAENGKIGVPIEFLEADILSPRDATWLSERAGILSDMVEQTSTGWILSEYYFGGSTLAQIAERHGFTESRACQLKRQAIGEAREYLMERGYESWQM